MTNFSTYGINLALTGFIQSQQNRLSDLSQEVASGRKFSNLTQYTPTDARTVLDGQTAINQRNSYIASIQNVQARLSVYDTTMGDMENMAVAANQLATQNPSYDVNTVDKISQQATNYLRQMTDDLNQQVAGRYIYSGVRYTTKPVSDLTTLTSTLSSTTTTSPALPTYDTQFSNATSFNINTAPPTGNFVVGNVSIPWSQIASGNVTSITVNSSPYTPSPAIAGLAAPATTTTQLASNLAATLNALKTQAPSSAGISSLTTTSSTNQVTFDFGGTTPASVTPDSGGVNSETTWVGGSTPAGTIAQTPNSSSAAYTQDTVLIDTGYSVTYGVSSNDVGFQNTINGMRYILAACTAGKNGDTATYKADMLQASTLLANGLTGIQNVHSQVASNQNILASQSSTQTADITALQNQLSDIQNADLTAVGAEINLLQTQLQASYSATSSLEKLSLVKYL